jgi:hypothetical protein
MTVSVFMFTFMFMCESSNAYFFKGNFQDLGMDMDMIMNNFEIENKIDLIHWPSKIYLQVLMPFF